MRRLVLVFVFLLASPVALVGAGLAGTPGAACADARDLPGVGRVCPAADGLLEVFAPDGRSTGYVHGADPRGPDVAVAATRGSPVPTCQDPGADYLVRPIYARAHDLPDGYNASLATIRGIVSDANRILDQAAIATGGHATLRVPCVDGVVTVVNAVLDTGAAQASFGSILADLADLGYNDPSEKYVVYYDDASMQSECGCSGIGSIYRDSRADAGNANNGNAGAMYAVDYAAGVGTWLHELGHNLGAVQLDAPHTSGGWHCVDGLDVMCYDDGGWNADNYTSGACSTSVFDCGHDDYFSRSPPVGSYLASHWNLGSRVVRFLAFEDPAPDVAGFACGPLPSFVGLDVACTWYGLDDGNVSFVLDWGDGAALAFPSGAPGVPLRATHAWNATGSYAVNVTVTDSAGQSTTRSVDVLVKPPCVYAGHEGELLVGLAGQALDGVSSVAYADVNEGCQGAPWSLTWSSAAPRALYEVCWTREGAAPTCDTTGWGAGRVPLDATGVRLVLDVGAGFAFRLGLG